MALILLRNLLQETGIIIKIYRSLSLTEFLMDFLAPEYQSILMIKREVVCVVQRVFVFVHGNIFLENRQRCRKCQRDFLNFLWDFLLLWRVVLRIVDFRIKTERLRGSINNILGGALGKVRWEIPEWLLVQRLELVLKLLLEILVYIFLREPFLSLRVSALCVVKIVVQFDKGKIVKNVLILQRVRDLSFGYFFFGFFISHFIFVSQHYSKS